MAISLPQFCIAASGFGLGLMAASFSPEPSFAAHADEKKSPDAFLSGGARSEKVLVEVLAILRQIDARVAVIEDSVKDGNASAGRKEKSPR